MQVLVGNIYLQEWPSEKRHSIEHSIRKDCFQVKSNLLTVDNLVFHLELQFLIKLKYVWKARA